MPGERCRHRLGVRADGLKRSRRGFDVAIIARRELHLAVAACDLVLPDLDQPIRVRKRKRPGDDVVSDRKRGGRRTDAERGDDDRGDREPWRSTERSDGVAKVLNQNVGMEPRGIDDRVRDDVQPQRGACREPVRVAPAGGEDGAELVAVRGPERRRVEMQQQTIQAHHDLWVRNPLARASLTSAARRSASARATAPPNCVSR